MSIFHLQSQQNKHSEGTSRSCSIVDHSNCRRDLPTVQVTGMIHSKEEGDDIETAEHVKHVGEKIPATRSGVMCY
ncbi:hypothetical protein TIFTF001_056817 [Ficus carica]|uniref:Uncharacterized protein n=1 Tax=Ficus carica TaxID=3494 RepID=A0AA88JFI2_FICCA|nr:hypothetical protein TIFTF001_056817 [Ficus carica]